MSHDPHKFNVLSQRTLNAMASRRRFLAGAAATGGALGLGRQAFASPSRQAAYQRQAMQEELSIIIGTLGEAPTINPFKAADSEENWRAVQIFDELIRIDPATYEPVPGIASEFSLDGSTVTLTIHPNVQFSDGTDVTADDVKFTIEGLLAPETASIRQAKFMAIVGAQEFVDGAADNVSGITAVDPKTVTIELATPDAAILYNMRYVRVVPKAQLEGKDLASDPWFQSPIGAGPFKFESWTTGADFVMLRNDNYFEEGKPAIQRVTHRVIADAQSLVLALINNEIDASNYPSPTGKAELEKNPDLAILVPPFNSANGWQFNMQHELLSNRDVRRGIGMALDREQFAADALLGLGQAGNGSPIAPVNWAFDDSLEPLPYDPEQARQLISGAGAEGAQIKFVVNAGNIQREDWLIYTQQALQDVGIEVIPETMEWATLVSSVTERKEFEVVGGDFAGVTAEPTELFEDFHSEGTSNYSSYSNPDLDALLEQARETIDIEAAKPIYSEIQKIIIEEVPFFFAWYRPFLHTVNNKWTGYTDSGQEGLFYTLKDWTAAS
jgi:peptide/nickel transport system substrate-binding protein